MDLAGFNNDRSGIVGEAPKPAARAVAREFVLRGWLKAISWGFYALVAALSLWVFSYASGIFPYLGTAEIDQTSGRGITSGSDASFGLGTMLLFEGQTAFFEYESTSAESEITFDVKSPATLGYSPEMRRVSGAGSGRIEIAIAQTGFYNFRHEPALTGRHGRTAYRVSWGAN
jgi:hypothetical protein